MVIEVGFIEEVKSLLGKTSIANVTSGVSILAGLYMLYASGNTDGVMFIVGGATGYLYGTSKNNAPDK